MDLKYVISSTIDSLAHKMFLGWFVSHRYYKKLNTFWVMVQYFPVFNIHFKLTFSYSCIPAAAGMH